MTAQVSRQTKHNHQRDLEHLRQQIPVSCPLVAGYNQETNMFEIAWLEDHETPLITGRMQIVATYIDGFVRAWINAPSSVGELRRALERLADRVEQIELPDGSTPDTLEARAILARLDRQDGALS